jgi:rhodanese-related sulfurtransferase/TusA-related sulfurtransferase
MSDSFIKSNYVLDCKGLACPMPIVRTKKAIDSLNPGEVIEVQATDKGSKADLQGWAKTTGNHYLGTVQEGDVLKHFVRKVSVDELKQDANFSKTISIEELESKLANDEPAYVLDVREPAEYAFERINGAKSIPLVELEKRLGELDRSSDIYVVCRTGIRSDFACQLLSENGFLKVRNVTGGMTGWKGPLIRQYVSGGS